MKWSIAVVVILLLLIVDLVYCSPRVNRDDDDDDSDDDSRHGADPRYSSSGRRQSRCRTSTLLVTDSQCSH